MTATEVIARRRAERTALLDLARRYAASLPREVEASAAAVFGSVARGDFHTESGIDVLIVAKQLPLRSPDRLAALGPVPPRVEVVAWTPEEWRLAARRRDPIAVEAAQAGVWVLGDLPAGLEHLRAELIGLATKPSVAALVRDIRRRKQAAGTAVSPEQILGDLDAE